MPLQRKRSWINWDGCEPVAAWQPLYAPSYRDSLWNWRDRFAEIGVSPTFYPATGWAFDGGTQYLDTGISGFPSAGTWIIMCTDGPIDGTTPASPFGANSLTPDIRYLDILINYYGSQFLANTSTAFQSLGSPKTAGIFACADRNYYENGVATGTVLTAGDPISDKTIYIGAAAQAISGITYPYPGKIQAFALWLDTLSAAQVWQRSQMLMHLANPDWSAWGRQRQYYFAPTAAAAVFQAAWAERPNRLIGGG